jgi:hypothetical protein
MRKLLALAILFQAKPLSKFWVRNLFLNFGAPMSILALERFQLSEDFTS